MFVRLFVCLFDFFLSVCLFECLSACLFECLFVRLFECLCVCPFVCLSVCMFVRLYVCFSVCVSVLPTAVSVLRATRADSSGAV